MDKIHITPDNMVNEINLFINTNGKYLSFVKRVLNSNLKLDFDGTSSKSVTKLPSSLET